MMPPEKTIRTWLADLFPDAHVGTEAPAQITGRTIRSVRSSGPGINQILDQPIFDVDCFDLTRDGARDFAEQVRDAFVGLAHTTIFGLAVTRVEVSMGPRFLPWDNTDVRRFAGTYALWCAAA